MGTLKSWGKATKDVMSKVIGPLVGHNELCEMAGYIENAGAPTSVTPDFVGQKLFDTTNSAWYRAISTAAGGWRAQTASLNNTAGAGITGGTGTIFKTSVERTGDIVKTSILIDLTGASSSTTDLDVIGQGASVAHLGQITAALNGTLILAGTMTCLEVPVGGVTDIDLYYATVGTAVFDDGIAALTETALITAGGAWTLALTKAFAEPVGLVSNYLYLCGGAAGTAAAYTAGKFLIEIYGYDA